MKLIGLNFDAFRSLQGVMQLPVAQARSVYDRLQNLTNEVTWLVFQNLPFIQDLSLSQQTSIYRQYLIDRMDAIRQIAIKDARRAEATYDNSVDTFDTLNWLRSRPGSGDSYVDRDPNNLPHILLESGDDLLLEDLGLILLEDDSA